MFTKEERALLTTNVQQHLAYNCYELSGKSYYLKFDDKRDYFVKFFDEQMALFGKVGEAPILVHYRALKGHERVYFVHLDLKNKPIYNITFVIDDAENLVTMVEERQHNVEELPHWFAVEFTFGYIDKLGFSVPEKRHEYTKDLVGSKIEWHYCDKDKKTHIYYDEYVRLAHPPVEEMSDSEKAVHQMMIEKGCEPFEEPVGYVKIKEGLYLVCFCEPNEAHKLDNKGGGGILLMDIKRTTDVGIFMDVDNEGNANFNMVSADGKFVYDEFPEEKLPSPHDKHYSLDGKTVK